MSSSSAMFAEQKAIIFGGANGIGRAVALELARRGAAVVIADIDQDNAYTGAAEIIASGGQAMGIACDVTDDLSMAAAVAKAEHCFGDIDIVINNVGVMLSGNPEDIPLAEWQRVMNLNLFSVVRSNDIFLPKMMARGKGHIINTASFAGLYPYAVSRLPYVAAKAAVVALSQSLAVHLLPKGIKVVCFCPGPVLTDVANGIKDWSDNTLKSGPGSQFGLISAEQSAVVLADGIAAGRLFIPTHEHVLDVMQQHAQSPDAFIEQKIREFEGGEYGLPRY